MSMKSNEKRKLLKPLDDPASITKILSFNPFSYNPVGEEPKQQEYQSTFILENMSE